MFNFINNLILYRKWSVSIVFRWFETEFLNTNQTNSYKSINFYRRKLNPINLNDFNSLIVINVFNTTGSFFSQINLNYEKPLFYISKQKYLKEEVDLTYPAIITILKSIYFFKYFFIFNKLNYINFKKSFLHLLNKHFIVDSLWCDGSKLIYIYNKPNFFYTTYQFKKIKKIKKSRKKQLFKKLKQIKRIF